MNVKCFVCGVLVLVASSSLGTAADERLTMRVTPLVSYAPTSLIVRTRIEPNQANRWIEVVAESDDFYRSSEVQLDGDQSPRSSRFEFRDLPSGQYTVAAVLKGSHGLLALKRQEIQVVSAPLAR